MSLTVTAWQEQQAAQARRDAMVAAGAATGRSVHKVFTTGRGDIRIASPVKFSLTFTEQPFFTSGCVLHAGSLVDHLYPTATVGVWKWQRDSRGMYTGAYIWVTVGAGLNAQFAGDAYLRDLQQQVEYGKISGALTDEIYNITAAIAQAKAEQAANKYQLEHHLVFEALAIRDVNYDQMMADNY
jgi:hypothetical protein